MNRGVKLGPRASSSPYSRKHRRLPEGLGLCFALLLVFFIFRSPRHTYVADHSSSTNAHTRPAGGSGGAAVRKLPAAAAAAKLRVKPEGDYDDGAEVSEDYDYDDVNKRDNAARQQQLQPPPPRRRGSPSPSAVGAGAPPPRFPPDLPFLEALAGCDTLDCVRDAHSQPRRGARFSFPHFIIIGFQKTATTSLYLHLAQHPELLRSVLKEPEFFSFNNCYYNLTRCSNSALKAAKTVEYINATMRLPEFLAARGAKAVFESSTHYVRNGDRLVEPLRPYMPWLKLVVSLREPISRATSMLVHLKDVKSEGCLMTRDLGTCLLEDSQINGDGAGARATNYSFPMRAWVEGWPSEQMHVIQYEELISEEGERKELRRVKRFLGVDPDLPKGQGLGIANARRFRIQPEGWEMKRWQYEALVALVRPDAEETAVMMAKGGLIPDARTFLERWEKVWDDNLATCDAKGDCKIQLS